MKTKINQKKHVFIYCIMPRLVVKTKQNNT